MNKSEEEQLLQDASTLLMFANVAAKQQQTHAPPFSQSPTQQSPSQQHQQPQRASQSPPSQFQESQPHHQRVPSSGYQGYSPVQSSTQTTPTSAVPPDVQQRVSPPIVSTTTSNVAPITATKAAKAERIPEVKSEQPPAAKAYYFPVPGNDQAPPPQPQAQQPQPQVQSQSQSPVSEPGYASSGSSSKKTPKQSPTQTVPQLQPPLQSPPQVQAQAVAQQGPPSASFVTHKRTGSGKFRHSPGPANIALAGGIIEVGGKRNNNNAMIAAAALADAANIPLPLLKKEERERDYRKNSDGEPTPKESSIATVNEVVQIPPAAPVGSTVVPPIEDSKRDETEVEEDATEDEKESKVNNFVDSGASTSQISTNGGSDMEDIQPSVVPSASIIAASVPEPQVKQEADQIQEVQNQQRPPVEVPPLSSYQVDPDAGLIGCICGIDDDDGFTIQCDICFRWQHCLCMNFNTNEEVPEVYKCYYCDKDKWGKFDPQSCRESTLARLESERLGEAELEHKKDLKRKQSNSEKGDQKKRKTSESRKGRTDDLKEPSQESLVTAQAIDTDIRPNSTISDSNNSNAVSINSPRSLTATSNELMNLPNKGNELLEDGITAESYQGTYYQLKDNDYKTQEIKKQFFELGKKCLGTKQNNIETITKNEFKAIKLSKILLPNYESKQTKKKGNGSSYNDTLISVKPYSDNQKQKFNGISKLGLFVSKKKAGVIPENTPIIEYLGELSFFQQYKEDQTNQYSTWGVPKPRVLKAEFKVQYENIANDDEVNKIMEEKEEKLSIVSDSRFVGNEARFIRSSCPQNANCVIKPVFIKDSQTFKLLIVTSKPIILNEDQLEEELRLEWQWDENHPIRKMYEKRDLEGGSQGSNGKQADTFKFDHFSESDKTLLISSVDNVLNFADCACGTTSQLANSNCALFKIKKATAYLLRSTRKALSVSSLGLGKSRDVLIINKKPKKYISWQERLDDRDKLITMNLLFTGEKGKTVIFSEDGSNTESTSNSIGSETNIASIKDIEIDTNATENQTSESRDDKSLDANSAESADVSVSLGTENDINDENEIKNDTELKLTGSKSETSNLRKASFKERLIAKSRKLKDIKVEFDKASMGGSICAPIVPELIIKIQNEVSAKITLPELPTQAKEILSATISESNNGITSSTTNGSLGNGSALNSALPITGLSTNKTISVSGGDNPISSISSSVLETILPSNKSIDLPVKSEETTEKKEEPIQKPQVVKKLSFADYKKKMK